LSDFSGHFAEVTANLDRRRSELLTAISGLGDADLARARRGGWTVGKVLEHITSAEWHYAVLVRHLRGMGDVAQAQAQAPGAGGVAGASEALRCSRAALLEAIDGVGEGDFYRLGTVGREEYSVVSVLENVEQHDLEHLGQIKSIQSASQ
jgi:uncharacterized damage-inducible protein DinB